MWTERRSRHLLLAFTSSLALLSASIFSSCARDEVSVEPSPTPALVNNEVSAEPSPTPAPVNEVSVEPSPAPAPVNNEAPPMVAHAYAPPMGSAGLNERVFDAAVIARVKLKGTTALAELIFARDDGFTLYQGLVQFTFETLEYLKGSGGANLIAVATVDHKSSVIQSILDMTAKGEFIDPNLVDSENPYTSMELALEAAKKWAKERVTTWDDREAIVMAEERPVPGSSDGSKRYWIGPIFDFGIGTTYAVWLPSAPSVGTQSAGQGQSETRYLLEPPNSGSAAVPAGASAAAGSPTPTQAATISVSEIKALSAELEQWRKDGAGVEGYEECIRQSFSEARDVNGMKERGESTYVRSDYFMDSGLPMESVVYAHHDVDGKTWVDGDDKDLFEVSPHGNGVFRTTRPIPKGKYAFYSNYQASEYIPCNYIPDDASNTVEHFVNVTAPALTLHEAFFDPVAISTAVGADATNGALKPASFAIDDTKTTTLDSIAWESRRATIKVSPYAVPANHHVDFIALDGTVALRLDVDDASKSVNGDDTTFTWGVCAQPWNAGDQLMLRISESTADLTGATNDLACDGTPMPTLTPPEAGSLRSPSR